MFQVNGTPILASEMTVLQTLKDQLADRGILRFAQFKQGTTNIQFNCPIHGDGQEHKPSCGITIVDKGAMKAGMVHCFTCGYTATLEEMISNLHGLDDLGKFGREWLVRNFITLSVETRRDIVLDFSRAPLNPPVLTDAVDEATLDSYRYTHPYMYKRKLTDAIIDKFDIGYDPHFVLRDKAGNITQTLRCITFPVRNEKGVLLFIARRSIDSKVFHYPPGVSKPVYGLWELPEDADEVVICESMFNALTCYVYGKPAVALLGLGTEEQYNQLRRLKCRKLITALDPDKAGMAATQKLKDALRGYKLVTTYLIPPGKDVNDLSKEEFDSLQEVF